MTMLRRVRQPPEDARGAGERRRGSIATHAPAQHSSMASRRAARRRARRSAAASATPAPDRPLTRPPPRPQSSGVQCREIGGPEFEEIEDRASKSGATII